MSKKSQLTSSETEKLRALNKELFDSMAKIGELEFALFNLNNKKAELIQQHTAARKYLQAEQKTLAEKYGEKRVDLETGNLTERVSS
jgi:phage host-nuclease inhibitor protein Gam